MSDVVYVADTVDRSFEDVRRTLTEAAAMPGSVVPVSRSMAILEVDGADGTGTAELRILPIHGGRDALTELVLISTEDEGAGSASGHAHHVAGARSRLAAIVRILEDS